MPPGPKPKPDGKRERRNAPTFETTLLDGSPAKAPPMPRGKWRAATRRWWKVWSESPQAKLFLSTDWERLEMLLPIVDAYFRGDLKLLAEIRLNEAKLGGTAEDRLRLRWRLREAKSEEEAEEKRSARRKRRRDPRLKVIEGGS